MSQSRITWSTAIKDRARAEGKGLLAFGCYTRHGGIEFHNAMDHGLADRLVDFAMSINAGRSPAEAFAAVDWGDGKGGAA